MQLYYDRIIIGSWLWGSNLAKGLPTKEALEITTIPMILRIYGNNSLSQSMEYNNHKGVRETFTNNTL